MHTSVSVNLTLNGTTPLKRLAYPPYVTTPKPALNVELTPAIILEKG
jgi:hypothetical protein